MAKSKFNAVVDPFDDIDEMIYALQEGDVLEAFRDKLDEMANTIVVRAVSMFHTEPERRPDDFLKWVHARLKDVYVAMEEVENKVRQF